MSNKLIGEGLHKEAYNELANDLRNKSATFLNDVRKAFLSLFSSKGHIEEVMIVRKNTRDVERMFERQFHEFKMLAIFNGIEIKEINPRGGNEEERLETEWDKIGYNPELGEVYLIRIVPRSEGGEKSPAQKMWEKLLEEYQALEKMAEENAKAVSQEVLQKLTQKDYEVYLNYNLGKIEVVVDVQLNEEWIKQEAWKRKVEDILRENGIDASYEFNYKNSNLTIVYMMEKG